MSGPEPQLAFEGANPDGDRHDPNVARETSQGIGNRPPADPSTSGRVSVLCGPLLNYKHTSQENTNDPIWHGSVLLVTRAGQQPAPLTLRMVRDEPHNDQVMTGSATYNNQIHPTLLYESEHGAFWRYLLQAHFQTKESTWEYTVSDLELSYRGNATRAEPFAFSLPAKNESMRIMFHSCNGFSCGTDEEAWSGLALWNDVLRVHKKTPFHVMIGGGDQIYNDGIRVTGPLKPWTDISSPHKRREYAFGETLRAQCDSYYYKNYLQHFTREPFSDANGQIPQLNIWDDHDIIDGFGSYTNHFMRSSVFRGIGGVAHKYYCLFQHHVPPPKSTYTTDAPQTLKTDVNAGTTAADSKQLEQSWVMTSDKPDPSFIIGASPGPYVEERSLSLYTRLGCNMAFIGIDARTERTRHQINYPETYNQIFERAEREMTAAKGQIKHLILLLGVPIAYPRMAWAENILKSPIIGPLRFLNKRFGVAGGFFNSFDGQVDLLDDLDDHYTARQHKKERRELLQRFQSLSKKHNLRVTIVSGDVHLGAIGRFYSNEKQNISAEHDWRFMVNVVSSAITNKPPPQPVANLLARRNKVHHLDHETDETLFYMFDKDPSEIVNKQNQNQAIKAKAGDANLCTMPSRNYAIIQEIPRFSDAGADGSAPAVEHSSAFARDKNPRKPIHFGETNYGASHPSVGLTDSTADEHERTNGDVNGIHANGTRDGVNGTANGNGTNGNGTLEHGRKVVNSGGLDVTLRVEIDPGDAQGHTVGYGYSIPALDCTGYSSQGTKW